MKPFPCILFVLSILALPGLSQSITELEKQIESYKNGIELYQQKIDSLNLVIQKIIVDSIQDALMDGVYFIAKQRIRLYETPNAENTKSICDIQIGDSVLLIKKKNDLRYEALFKGNIGYMSEWAIKKSVSEEMLQDYTTVWEQEKKILLEQQQSELEILKAEMERENAEKEKKIAEEAERRKADLIQKYGETIGMKIYERKIWLGMTTEMARESWGNPDDINRTIGTWGVHEQWIYDRYDTYLYFEDGILTSWQD